MRDPHRSYDDQAERLRKITGLVPIQILSDHLRHEEPVRELIISPPDYPDGRPRLGLIVGIRLFHGPREIIIDKVCLNGRPVVDGPLDAAAYTIETPLPPLETPVDSNYRGEALRFVATPWGVFSRATPLCIYARPWGTPSARPQLAGYLVIELDQNLREEVQR